MHGLFIDCLNVDAVFIYELGECLRGKTPNRMLIPDEFRPYLQSLHSAYTGWQITFGDPCRLVKGSRLYTFEDEFDLLRFCFHNGVLDVDGIIADIIEHNSTFNDSYDVSDLVDDLCEKYPHIERDILHELVTYVPYKVNA